MKSIIFLFFICLVLLISLDSTNQQEYFQDENSSIFMEFTTVETEQNCTMDYLNTTFHYENTEINYDLINFYALYPVDEWKKIGFFDDLYVNSINNHWLKFKPQSHFAHYIFAIVYLLLAIISLSGNALVIFMILYFRSLRTPSNFLVINLATSDFFMMSKAPIFIYNSLHFGPVLGEFGCQLYGFLGGLTGTASIMTLAAISLDRYYVIAHPLDPTHKTSNIRALIWILFIWIYSSIFSTIPLCGFYQIKYVPEGYLTSCSFDYLSEAITTRIFIFIFFIAAWCVPLCIILFSYIGICRAVLVVGMSRKGQEKEKRRRELKLAVLVVIVIALWFISWTPYAIVALLGITGNENYISPTTSMVPAIFCKTAACLNPFVYSLNHPRLKEELYKLFCRKKYNLQRSMTQKSIWKTEGSFTKNRRTGSSRRKDSIGRNSEEINFEELDVATTNV